MDVEYVNGLGPKLSSSAKVNFEMKIHSPRPPS